MITRIPALEFMQNLVGTYHADAQEVEFKVWSCGYGVAVQLSSKTKVQLVGVVGAYGQDIECFAQVGLPNVVRLHGRTTSGSSVVFEANEPPINLSLSAKDATVEFRLQLSGHERVSYVLHRA